MGESHSSFLRDVVFLGCFSTVLGFFFGRDDSSTSGDNKDTCRGVRSERRKGSTDPLEGVTDFLRLETVLLGKLGRRFSFFHDG